MERVVAQKFEPNIAWTIFGPSDQLAAALDAPLPVVYVRVDDDPSWGSSDDAAVPTALAG